MNSKKEKINKLAVLALSLASAKRNLRSWVKKVEEILHEM